MTPNDDQIIKEIVQNLLGEHLGMKCLILANLQYLSAKNDVLEDSRGAEIKTQIINSLRNLPANASNRKDPQIIKSRSQNDQIGSQNEPQMTSNVTKMSPARSVFGGPERGVPPLGTPWPPLGHPFDLFFSNKIFFPFPHHIFINFLTLLTSKS